jgi:hypothetical protein
MPYTAQQIVDDARVPLNDADKVRYSDALLLTYLNHAILLARKSRPDLFLGLWATLPADLTLVSEFPVDDMYYPLFVDYVTGRAETLDDEHVESSRAMAFIQNFNLGLRA